MSKVLKIVTVVFLSIATFYANYSYSQTTVKKKKPKTLRESERKSMHVRDSLFQALNKSDTSINYLLQDIQQYTTTFNQINNSLSEGLDTVDESEQLPAVTKRIAKITALANTHKSSTLRYLFVLRDNLDHLQDQLQGWQDDLDDVNTKLVQHQHDLLKFKSDALLANAIPSDTAVRDAFFDSRAALGQLWRSTDSVNRKDLFRINLIQNKVATAFNNILDESDQIDSKIKKFAARAFSGEYGFILEKNDQYSHLDSALRGTIKLNTIQVSFFFKNETTVHLIALGFLVLIVSWILYNRLNTVKHVENKEIITDHARFVYKNPLVSALLLVTTITPYFYDHPPVFILESAFLITTVLVLILVRSYFPLSLFHFLLQLFFLTIIYSLSNLLIQITNFDRYLILTLSVASIFFAAWFFVRLKKEPQGHLKYTKLTLYFFMAMQLLSLILNITGRFSLSKIVGITAVFNLWLTMSLYFIIRIIIQTLFLQLHSKRAQHSLISYVDYSILQSKLRNILSLFAGLLWIFFLLQNLNIDDLVHDSLIDFLTLHRSIGDSTFTLGGFVLFFIVIWASSMLSKLISYFYDISAQHSTDLTAAKKKNRASTLLIRIAVFTVGFLLAVAASGFPLDKLTIIFSAFGVGIGFGLQNVTNNLVSGMILAFEKPIQIGDIIEVDGKSGTVMEIGIRSSKLGTSDGSEVIIPNADLISHHVENWTLNNSNRRIQILISAAYGSDIEKVKKLLTDMLTKRNDIMKTPEPSVFVNNITDKSVDFRLLFWAADLSTSNTLRSLVLSDIYAAFNKEGIVIPAPK